MTARSTGAMDPPPEKIDAFDALMDASTVGAVGSSDNGAVPDAVQGRLSEFAAHLAGLSSERSEGRDRDVSCGADASGHLRDAVVAAKGDPLRPAPSPWEFELTTSESGALMFSGALDARTAGYVRARLHAAVDDGTGDLVLVLTGLTAWDATGLGVIMGTHRHAGRAGRRLVLRGVPLQLQRLLVATKLHRILTTDSFSVDSVTEPPLPPDSTDPVETSATIEDTTPGSEPLPVRNDALRFQLLGPVWAWKGDQPVTLGSRKQVIIAGVLAMHAGRAVTMQQLIDVLWGETPPRSAATQVQVFISGLRRVFQSQGTSRAQPVLVTVPGGYLLRVDAEAVDALAFERRVDEAESMDDLAQVHEHLSSALRLWSGEPLLGITGHYAERERTRLIALRRHAQELRLDAQSALNQATSIGTRGIRAHSGSPLPPATCAPSARTGR